MSDGGYLLKNNDFSAHKISFSPLKINRKLDEDGRYYSAPEKMRLKKEICVMLLDVLL
jgi:hypothetical protein